MAKNFDNISYILYNNIINNTLVPYRIEEIYFIIKEISNQENQENLMPEQKKKIFWYIQFYYI